jgi:Protein of unknown function (DUF2957)
MPYAISKGFALALATAPLVVACGGNADTPAPINSPQCSGASCGPQGAPAVGAGAAPLCPATAAIVSSTYLGGAGSGEIVSLNIDAVNMTYTLKWLESPIPLVTGTVTPTRKGTTISGAVVHPPAGALPTAEQTRCAFVLTPGGGVASDGSVYTTAAAFNQANPPTIFVGQGVAGGGIPGATVQYSGATVVGAPVQLPALFPVPNRHFDFYPFIGFSTVSTNISDLKGTYNALLYRTVPSNNYSTTTTMAQESFDAAGNCSVPVPASNATCQTTGGAWTANANGSYFTSAVAPQVQGNRSVALPPLGTITYPAVANANMVLGKINGAIVPIVVRTGQVFVPSPLTPLNTNAAQVDDESGLSMLAANTALTSGAFDGGYVGADSNFKYTATLLQGPVGSFINPSTQASETGFGMSYAQQLPGLIGVQDQNGGQGALIAAGGLYGIFIQGSTVNGGLTSTSANTGTPASPYFGIGALLSK